MQPVQNLLETVSPGGVFSKVRLICGVQRIWWLAQGILEVCIPLDGLDHPAVTEAITVGKAHQSGYYMAQMCRVNAIATLGNVLIKLGWTRLAVTSSDFWRTMSTNNGLVGSIMRRCHHRQTDCPRLLDV